MHLYLAIFHAIYIDFSKSINKVEYTTNVATHGYWNEKILFKLLLSY